jgi:hypothetical protein
MWPMFRHYELGVWNHRAIDVSTSAIDRRFGSEYGRRAAAWADHVILTTPPDRINDDRWQTWIGASQARTIVHLGHRRNGLQLPPAHDIAAYALDDVIALRDRQADVRSRRLTDARAACRERAVHFNKDDRRLPFATLTTA